MLSGGRDRGLDAARGVALLSMFVAHFAPVAGPGKVLTLSEHLTAFLFVLLIGCGAELGRRSPGRWRSSQVRAAALVVGGLLLMQLPTQIVVVLVWLGLMSLLAMWISHLPAWAIAATGVLAAVVEPPVLDWARDWLAKGGHDVISTAAVDIAFGGGSYRLAAFVLPACAGILLVRLARAARARTLVAAASAAVVVALVVLDQAGTALLVPYSGSLQEIVFNTALALAVAGLTWVVAPRLSVLGTVLAGAGAMALTIYALQIVGDWAYFKGGGATDDRWIILVGACAGALVLGAAWLPVARATGWRGPLEGPVDALARGQWPSRTAGGRRA